MTLELTQTLSDQHVAHLPSSLLMPTLMASSGSTREPQQLYTMSPIVSPLPSSDLHAEENGSESDRHYDYQAEQKELRVAYEDNLNTSEMWK